MKPWTLSIPLAPPSANTFMRLHWSKRRKLAEAWGFLILEAAQGEVWRAVPAHKRRVSVTLHLPRERDFPNLMLAVDKLILDNLVKFGILVDDSPTFLDLDVRQRKSKNPMTVIVISEKEV